MEAWVWNLDVGNVAQHRMPNCIIEAGSLWEWNYLWLLCLQLYLLGLILAHWFAFWLFNVNLNLICIYKHHFFRRCSQHSKQIHNIICFHEYHIFGGGQHRSSQIWSPFIYNLVRSGQLNQARSLFLTPYFNGVSIRAQQRIFDTSYKWGAVGKIEESFPWS